MPTPFGSTGKVLLIDKDGDARIDFHAAGGKLWVSKNQFRKMHKHPDAGDDDLTHAQHACRSHMFSRS